MGCIDSVCKVLFVGIRYGNMFRIMESYHMDLEDITLSHQVAQVLIE